MNFSRFLLITLTAVTLTASAQAESWGLLLYKEGSGQGRVCVAYDDKNECQVDDANQETNIELNEHIRLRATPEPGSHFVQWVGDCRGRSAVCEMLTQKPHNNKPLTATALFAQGPAKPVKVAAAPVKKTISRKAPSSSKKPLKSKKKKHKKRKTIPEKTDTKDH